jgi:DNA uptake protein ComE-like DNA-binding protein
MLYSRAERRAMVALVILIVLVILIPRAYHFYLVKPSIAYQDTALIKEMGVLQIDSDRESVSDKTDTGYAHHTLFYFDPNTISTDDWIRLGLSDKQAAVIERYRSKGGQFRSPDDLRKIYVLSDEEKDRLVPYVKIRSTGDHIEKKRADKSFTIEVNSADSSAFEQLYGIGPALSVRIIKFRRLLGGFYSIEQVGETYGISDTVFQNIRPHLKVNVALINKININEADYETLRKHPYIHAKIAHAIIGYRDKNGRFEDLDQLKTLKPVTDIVFEEIKPYLNINK